MVVGLLGIGFIHIGAGTRGRLPPLVHEAVKAVVILDLLGWGNFRAVGLFVKPGGVHDGIAEMGVHGAVFAGPSCDFLGGGEVDGVEIVTSLLDEGPNSGYGLVKDWRVLLFKILLWEEARSETPIRYYLAWAQGTKGLLRVCFEPVNIDFQIDTNGIDFFDEGREELLRFGLGHTGEVELASVLECSWRCAVRGERVDVVPSNALCAGDLGEPGEPDVNTLPECRIVDLNIVRCGDRVRDGVGLPVDLALWKRQLSIS